MIERSFPPLARAVRIALVLTVVFPATASAQMFSYGGTSRRSVQAFSFTTYLIDFDYNGKGDPETRLDFSSPAYGVTYNRPSFSASVLWGSAESDSSSVNSDLNIVDASITFWGNIIRTEAGSSTRVGVPIVIHSGYRSVDPVLGTNPNDNFSYSTLGIGGGLSLHSEFSSRFWFDLRAWPTISMSFRSFEGFAGSSFLVDTDAQFHVLDLFGNMGFSLAYGFRYQSWNNNESGLPGGLIRADQFDYKSAQHILKAGINW